MCFEDAAMVARFDALCEGPRSEVDVEDLPRDSILERAAHLCNLDSEMPAGIAVSRGLRRPDASVCTI